MTSPTRPASWREAIWRCLPSRRSSRRIRGMIVNWMPITEAAIRPSQMFCTMMNAKAVRPACRGRPGVMKASPMKPPIGSTSSLMIVAVSDDLTVRSASGVNRRTRANRSNRIRRSIRSPSAPLATLIQYLNAPLIRTKNRNTPDRPNSRPTRSTSKPSKRWTVPPPSQRGSSKDSVEERRRRPAPARRPCPGSPRSRSGEADRGTRNRTAATPARPRK